MNYDTTDTQKHYSRETNKSNTMVDCSYFTTGFLPLEGAADVKKDGSSFTVYICTEGEYTIACMGKTFSFGKGDTVLVPAAIKEFKLTGKATLLEIYIS